MIGLLSESFLKFFKSSGRCHGSSLFTPIALFRDIATMIDNLTKQPLVPVWQDDADNSLTQNLHTKSQIK
jgi:hypothetical protein